MSSIEKNISSFIEQQFPSFYRDQGPNFIAFIRAYYEWMEQSNNTIGHARSLLEYGDIDSTSEQFIKNFKFQFAQSLPDNTVADKRLLIKHILDLYRSKGTPRAVELLFRMVFNEDIELYIPNENIFRPSDNIWKIPRYLEVKSNPNINKLAGTQIQNVGNTAFAIVENVSSRIVNGRTINVLEISSIRGDFARGDRIYQTNNTDVPFEQAISIIGSLTAVAITQGGANYSLGDIIDVTGSGVEAKARVSAISDRFIGALNYTIGDGGTGYTTNAVVTVQTTLNLNIIGLLGFINGGDQVIDSVTSANGTVLSANSTVVRLINFTQTPSFTIGSKVIGPSGNATITRVLGGAGSGGSFKVGSITDRELISFNITEIESYLTTQLDQSSNTLQLNVSSISGIFNAGDQVTSTANVVVLEGFTSSATSVANGESLSNTSLGITDLFVYRSDGALISCTGPESDLDNANLVSGISLVSNTSSSVFELIITPSKQTITGEATVEFSNGTAIVVGTVNGYFIPLSTVTDSNTAATAIVDNVVRLTDWDLEGSAVLLDNLDTLIEDGLPLLTLEVGTIDSLTQINPGSGYITVPHITVIEPLIANQLLIDSRLTQKGNNAIITSTIAGGNGSVTAVDIVDSGYGYVENENVTLVSNTNPNLISGISIVYRSGRGTGRWLNRRSFPSDVNYIQDGFFYQNYSYQIIAQRMLSSYEKLVRDLVHPSGVALFGAYRSIDYIDGSLLNNIQTSLIQQ
jgi:hypothetical protein